MSDNSIDSSADGSANDDIVCEICLTHVSTNVYQPYICSCQKDDCYVKLLNSNVFCKECYSGRIKVHLKKCVKCSKINCSRGMKEVREGYMASKFYCFECSSRYLGKCKVCGVLTKNKYYFSNGVFFFCVEHYATPYVSYIAKQYERRTIYLTGCGCVGKIHHGEEYICEKEKCPRTLCEDCVLTKGRRRFDFTAGIFCEKCESPYVVAEIENFYKFRKEFVKSGVSEAAWRFISPYF